ncbi:MAG: pyruvate kinase, partial [Candidatus Woesearchaeota archaeon]
MQKLTKIIATIGPASDSVETIKELHESGMDIARLNFSHGDYEYFSKIIDRIREVDENICIMLDTKGPEIRTNPFDGEGMQLKKGDEIAIEESTENSSDVIRINYPVGEIADGTIVYLDDGLISAKVNNGQIKVLNDGFLGNKKSVTFKEHDAKLPFLTEKDKEDIRFG